MALITTGGVHLSTQQPFNMKDPSGDPSFREIPANESSDNLLITHIYYDHSDADKDINIDSPGTLLVLDLTGKDDPTTTNIANSV